MKKTILPALLTTLFVVAVSVIFSCQKNTATNNQQSSGMEQVKKISGSTYTGVVVGTIDGTTGDVDFSFDVDDFKNYLITNFSSFLAIEDIELNINDPVASPSYLTVIGSDDSGGVAVQVDVFVVGTDIIMQVPNDDTDAYIAQHTCRGNPCESCRFTRNILFKITGCDCRESNPYGSCAHSSNSVIQYPDLYAFFE